MIFHLCYTHLNLHQCTDTLLVVSKISLKRVQLWFAFNQQLAFVWNHFVPGMNWISVGSVFQSWQSVIDKADCPNLDVFIYRCVFFFFFYYCPSPCCLFLCYCFIFECIWKEALTVDTFESTFHDNLISVRTKVVNRLINMQWKHCHLFFFFRFSEVVIEVCLSSSIPCVQNSVSCLMYQSLAWNMHVSNALFHAIKCSLLCHFHFLSCLVI